MANEFYYSVSLSILHPSLDAKLLTSALKGLHPRIETTVGDNRRDHRGKLIHPPRKALYSHWLAELHAEKRLYSGDLPFSTFLATVATELAPRCDVLKALNEEGEVILIIAWYSEHTHPAAIIDAEVLIQFGACGVSVEFNVYCNSPPPSE